MDMRRFMTKKSIISTFKPSCVEAVGFKIAENDEYIVLCRTMTKFTYSQVISVPKKALVEINEITPNKDFRIITYQDTKMSGAGVRLQRSEVNKAFTKMLLTTCGFFIYENDEYIVLATERSEKGMYRTYCAIPKVFITK